MGQLYSKLNNSKSHNNHYLIILLSRIRGIIKVKQLIGLLCIPLLGKVIKKHCNIISLYSCIYFLKGILPFSLIYLIRFIYIYRLYSIKQALNYKYSIINLLFNSNNTITNKLSLNIIHRLLLLWSLLEIIFYLYTLYIGNKLQARVIPDSSIIPNNFRTIFVERTLNAAFASSNSFQLNTLNNHKIDNNSNSNPSINNDNKPNNSNGVNSEIRKSNSSLSLLMSNSGYLIADARALFSGWFYNCSCDDIYEDNILEYISFYSYGKELPELNPDQLTEVKTLWNLLCNGLIDKIKLYSNALNIPITNKHHINSTTKLKSVDSRTNIALSSDHKLSIQSNYSNNFNIPAGYNKKVRCMRIAIDEVKYNNLPLLYYGGVKLIDLFGNINLLLFGYRKYTLNGFNYWFRKGKINSTCNHNNKTINPILFVHGIGIALTPYLSFIRQLHKYNSVNTNNSCKCEPCVYLLELSYISMKLCYNVPTPQQHVNTIVDIISKHTPNELITLIGHSYGTLIASWIIKQRADILNKTILIDAICFMLFESSLCYNFLYRNPITPMQMWIHHFVARELYIAYTLQRHFYWYLNVLWLEDIINIRNSNTPNNSINNNNNNNVESIDIDQRSSELHHIQVHLSKQSATNPNSTDRSISTTNTNNKSNDLDLHNTQTSTNSDSNNMTRCIVFLSDCDDIVETKLVANYLMRARYNEFCKVYIWNNMKHAQFLFNKQAQLQILQSIQ